MTPALLALQEVTFRYNSHGQVVFERFSIQVRSGSITAILGPNGAGKTTMLHLLLGWLHPQDGRVLLNDQPLRAYSRRELGQWIALVPQGEHIPYDYTVLEYALFGRTPYLRPLDMPTEEDRQAARQALEQVGISEKEHQFVTRMSGGERQLVLIARALAQQPRILLLDEPTSHLDLGNKNRLLHLLHELNCQGVTILLTTHEPEVAAGVASDVILMNRGRVLRSGPLEQVFTSQALSEAYGVNVRVHQLEGRRVVLWM